MKPIYLPYEKSLRLPMNDVIEDLRKHGRAIVYDPKVMKSLSMKLKPYKKKKIVVCAKNREKTNIIVIQPGYELSRNKRCFSIKKRKW